MWFLSLELLYNRSMNSYQLTVVEPSAIRMLEEMARKNLIKLSPLDSKERFRSLLAKLREKDSAPTADEIQAEVEAVRTERYTHED